MALDVLKPDMEDDAMDDVEEVPEPEDVVTSALMEAFPEKDWTPAATAAFREAVQSCMDEYGPAEMGPEDEGEGGKGATLDLIFGSPKKGKS